MPNGAKREAALRAFLGRYAVSNDLDSPAVLADFIDQAFVTAEMIRQGGGDNWRAALTHLIQAYDKAREAAVDLKENDYELPSIPDLPDKPHPGLRKLREWCAQVSGAGRDIGAGAQPSRKVLATRGTADESRPTKLPKLGRHDRQAYQLWVLDGWTQQRIAGELNSRYGTTYSQGHISRIINRARKHAEASHLADLIVDRPAPTRSVDPSRLELGRRTGGK